MIWIVLAILVVGYFIVRAVNRSSISNATIAQQQYLNSPEYKKQRQASIDYFEYTERLLDNEIDLVNEKIRAFSIPESFTGQSLDDMAKGVKPKTYSKRELVKANNDYVKNHEKRVKDLESDYLKEKEKYIGYEPEPIETTVTKYGLNEAFSGEDWIEEEGTYGLYKKKQHELRKLQTELSNLQKGIDTKKLRLDEAIKIVRETKKASASFLQRKMDIGYGEAARLMREMESKGVIGHPDGSKPREVL
jgi:ribosomal protein S25